jgi:hypothetical protein
MSKGFFSLNWRDLGRGAIVAIISGIALPVLAIFQTPGFDVANVNWTGVLALALNGGIAALAGYLSKNLFSDSAGRFAGKV